MKEITYKSLYQKWEENNWSATALDFSSDQAAWKAIPEPEQAARLWLYSMFFVGEDAVADGLSPYIEAAPREEHKYFLATQQVDEARHAVFFDRFFRDVVGAKGEDISEHLNFAQSHLSWGHKKLFAKLEEVCASLWKDGSLPNFARAVTLYHMVVEGTVAQPGQHFIEDHLLAGDKMPAFSEGMRNVSRDEQRHIAFGVICLRDLFALSSECKEAAAEILEETMPFVAGILQEPPGHRYFASLPFSQEDIFLWSTRSMERKWKETGYPVEEMPRKAFPLLYPGEEEMAARDQVLLLRKGVLGEERRIQKADKETVEALFRLLARISGNTDSLFAVSWKFPDAPSASLLFSPEKTEARTGQTEGSHLVLRTSWPTWVEIFRGEKSMLQEIATGSVKVEKGFTKIPLLGKVLS